MSNHESLTTQSNSTMVPPSSKLKTFLHDDNSGRLFVILARRVLNAPILDKVVSTPQSFHKILQSLDD